ncbi:hypothetical protein E8E12_006224 [Didymella heteroderae]|uniref:KANL3/Tex30 alpha/beta hydrolase-like domain-containing protein n=1 Tax=Didymella heteroderae TaxID=1769908 RepID=A0A9P4WPI3_9PLEO|nr:hypothetical protein E8E12_006224 [Didymella heteroderae]
MAHLSKKGEPFKPLLIRINILGTDESPAKPWLVVHSPAPVVKEIESFFSKEFARSACADVEISGGLEVAFVGRPLRLRAGPLTEVEVAFAFTEADVHHPWSGPITLTQLSAVHRATTGGMLVIDNPDGIHSIFGLTVGHLLHHENASGSQMLDYDVDAFVSWLESGTPSVTQKRPLGRIAESSFSKNARDLDWALIQFSEATLLSDFVTEEPAYEKFTEGNCKGTVTFRPNFLHSGTAKLSSLPASAILPVGESFVRTYPIVISGVQEFDLPIGSSGSWVVSERSLPNEGARFKGEVKSEEAKINEISVHGMIIADDFFGEIYMLPLDEIIASMEEAMSGMSISLPSDTNEIVRLLNEQSFRMDRTATEPPRNPKIKDEPGVSPYFRPQEPFPSGPSMSRPRNLPPPAAPTYSQPRPTVAQSRPATLANPDSSYQHDDSNTNPLKPKESSKIVKERTTSTKKAKKAIKTKGPKSKPATTIKSAQSKESKTTTTSLSPVVLIISSDLVKKPISGHRYTPTSTKAASKNSAPFIFTHGAGGTLSAPAVVNFCTGFSTSSATPLLTFEGSSNLSARVKGFHACHDHLSSDAKDVVFGGRSMGARAAVMAGTELIADDDGNNVGKVRLVLVSYPLQGPKDVRDQILIDLPETTEVLFIIGDRDGMCPLELLDEVRKKMQARSSLVVVKGADHGMNARSANRTQELGEETGRVAARWLSGDVDNEGETLYVGEEE